MSKTTATYLIINDRMNKVLSEHATKEEAVASLMARGYRHHSSWTYRNPETRDYCHVSESEQYKFDMTIVEAAEKAGMTVDAYLQRVYL